jgi:hypothetical protein
MSTETEALLIAAEDAEADTGAYAVDEYLRVHFLPAELVQLGAAATVLAERCDVIHEERTKKGRG